MNLFNSKLLNIQILCAGFQMLAIAHLVYFQSSTYKSIQKIDSQLLVTFFHSIGNLGGFLSCIFFIKSVWFQKERVTEFLLATRTSIPKNCKKTINCKIDHFVKSFHFHVLPLCSNRVVLQEGKIVAR